MNFGIKIEKTELPTYRNQFHGADLRSSCCLGVEKFCDFYGIRKITFFSSRALDHIHIDRTLVHALPYDLVTYFLILSLYICLSYQVNIICRLLFIWTVGIMFLQYEKGQSEPEVYWER